MVTEPVDFVQKTIYKVLSWDLNLRPNEGCRDFFKLLYNGKLTAFVLAFGQLTFKYRPRHC